ncbi:hypothetical protein ABG79_00638 [Caloramator mitchellensis]|uniref:SbsA Ig-like domain-containing protein n=1 Tax=Caloramator mitchellensis TaxID=908809 RepID=A0A0R3JWA3_CALMK|nr:Ig-like domain-containing protein [Caloramator mitchellensis]KRQ87833.1 hypothetical protein ABG79_00638 [Caloramator mitchellensis]
MKKIFLSITIILVLFIDANAASQFDKIYDNISPDKVWTIKFNRPYGYTTLNNSIQLTDQNGNKLTPQTSTTSDPNALQILPPSGGYTFGNTYYLTISRELKSANGKRLIKPYTMKFTIMSGYQLTYEVKIGGLNILKEIKISKITLPNAYKYKLDDSSNYYKLDEIASLIVPKDYTTIQFYDSNGNYLGKASIYVKTSNTQTTNITR